jgi:hypothetical protein
MRLNRSREIDQRKEAAMPAVELELEVDAEVELVRGWRRAELERAGYSRVAAEQLAELSYVDLHLATNLLRRGCPAETALRILV